ncbi:unnamed protein product [Paramecium pentaurelia]|uniref:Uncharacterized protein n=1 Tax=Paramecium pentaurelia TaxID=43138 RepID=A0A8S1WCG7_9CILI|nr:unnamed protein product [Paramecium pentaurelia]
MLCNFHPQIPISLICVAPHKCQRKLCVECQYEHKVEIRQTVPISKFREQVIKKFSELKIDGTSELTQLRMKLKQMLSQTEIQIKNMWSDLTELTKQIYDMIEKKDKQFIDLINNNDNFAESSFTDLDKLVQIMNEKILDEWNIEKNSQITKLEAVQIWFGKEMQAFHQKYNEQMKAILQIVQTQNDEKFIWKEAIYQQKSSIWDQYGLKFINTTFLIKFTKEQEIQYIRDGSIIKRWFGSYGKNNQKVGKWKAIWKGESLKDVGGQYSNEGKKQGNWKEIIPNFWSKALAFEIGEYIEGQRRGTWKQYYKDQQIYGGEYNDKGEKNGIWREFWQGFWEKSFVIYNGEYKNGKKVGKWEILWKTEDEIQFKKIGGGQYKLEDAEVKIGQWIELSEGFWDKSQVTYCGEYQNGKKVGGWNIYYKQEKIGGGQYDKNGNETQVGQWVELSEGFWDRSQIIYCGNYLNGKRVGKWKILMENRVIGGSYDELGSGNKIGLWIEQSEGIWERSVITYNGEYKNGKKIGRWDTFYENKKIAGGSYDEQGNELMIGQWINLSEGFYDDSQVTYCGGYQNGKKVGRWDTLFQNKKIGGGQYDSQGEELKIGQWIDLSDGFQYYSQVTYQGEYKIGKKVGRWDINFQGSKIGGGLFDEKGDGIKIGQWVELGDGFWEKSQVTYNGHYNNGKKNGQWDILYRGSKIGGGSYDLGGNGIKVGKWIELKDGFYQMSQITQNGEYEFGKKIGTWIEMDLNRCQKLHEFSYDH